MRKSVTLNLLAGLVSVGMFTAMVPSSWAREHAYTDAAPDALATVALNALPQQAVETYHLIHQGGPFPQEKDGVVFFNRERILPQRARGYYLEYTVRTPSVAGRGGKRIVCGGKPVTPQVCFYTADHYASFRRIVP